MVDAKVCSSCASRSRLRRVWWLGTYGGELKELVWQIKYQRSRANARLLGAYLHSRLPYLPNDTLVVPIPTASNRVRRRGFDQATIIAEEFAKRRNFKLVRFLRRKGQAELIGLKRKERLEQMQQSFSAERAQQIKGASVLLIDDVLTTGATLEAAATILRDHGASHVDGAILTRRIIH